MSLILIIFVCLQNDRRIYASELQWKKFIFRGKAEMSEVSWYLFMYGGRKQKWRGDTGAINLCQLHQFE